MGRNKLVGEKKISGSFSWSVSDKEFLELKGLSTTQVMEDALLRLRTEAGQNPKSMEFDADIEKVRLIYVKTERGLLEKEKYFLAIKIFMDKWTDVTKPEVMGRVERTRYYMEPKEVENNGEGKCL